MTSWQTFARRAHAPISARLLQEAQRRPTFEAVTGIPFGLNSHVWLDGTIFIPQAEQDALEELVNQLIPRGDWSFLADFVARCRSVLEDLVGEATRLGEEASQKGRRDRLASDLADWFACYRRAMAFVPVFRTVDRVLVAQISEDRTTDFLVGSGHQMTEEARERIDLEQIAAHLADTGDLVAESDEAKRLIEGHVRKYSWIGLRWYLGTPFSAQDFHSRVVAMIEAPAVALAVAPEGEAFSGQSNPEEIEVVNDLAFLRTHRAEVVNKAVWTAMPLLENTAQLLGISYTEFVHMLPFEILDGVGGQEPNRDVLSQRQECFGTAMLNGEFAVYSGRTEISGAFELLGLDAEDEADLNERPSDLKDDVILRGVVASAGRTTGTVRLVRGREDEAKVGMGDILVTTMTFPSLVGSMQRSGAIVTDDGGLLSHAAVTARELGKPCLIDTQIATKCLVDGQVVEVDCETGVVRAVQLPANDYEKGVRK